MRGSHLGDQRDEAVSVARWCAPVAPPPPVIARRRWKWRRSGAGVHVHVDLETGKIGDDVQEVRHEEMKRKGEERGAGVVGARPELQNLPAAMAARRGQARAAWRHKG